MRRFFAIPYFGLLLLGACDSRPQPERALRVESVLPRSAAAATRGAVANPEPLWLNSKITVHFSEDIDPLSVTADTIRMVRITAQGPERVAMARRHIGARTVDLIPNWPLTASLDDGSFVPDQLYRLEVAGFPLTNTVYSRSGVPMGDAYRRHFRVVGRDAADPGPMLPVGLWSDPFDVAVKPLRMAADTRTLRLHFTLPLDPGSISPQSFRFTQGTGQDAKIDSVRILSSRRLPKFGARRPIYPGSTVELQLAQGEALDVSQPFGIDLRPAGREQHWIRDLRGRHIGPRSPVVSGTIYSGSRVELIHFEGAQDFRIDRVDAASLNFECRDGRIQPLLRREFGVGRHGVFRPSRDTVLTPRRPFYGDDGRLVSTVDRFEFTEIHIPKGVTVTLRCNRTLPDSRVDVVAFGDIRIDGELRLDTSHAMAPGDFESGSDRNYLLRVAEKEFGCRLACAGNLILNGSIRHLLPDSTKAAPLVMFARRLALRGPFPSGSILVQEPGRIPVGAAPGGVLLHRPANVGLPAGSQETAAGWTEWKALPADFTGGHINARAVDIQGDLEVLIQIAAPDPIDPSQAYRDPAGMSAPRRLPLRQSIPVNQRVFVRFQLRAKVRGNPEGVPPRLPSVRSLVVLGG